MGIVILDVSVDCGLELDDASKDAALEASLCEGGEEALDGVEPRGAGRGEVEGDAGMPVKPVITLGCLWAA